MSIISTGSQKGTSQINGNVVYWFSDGHDFVHLKGDTVTRFLRKNAEKEYRSNEIPRVEPPYEFVSLSSASPLGETIRKEKRSQVKFPTVSQVLGRNSRPWTVPASGYEPEFAVDQMEM